MNTRRSVNVAKRSNIILKCPKCKKQMEVALHEDVEVDTCPECKGVWVDLIEEKTLLQMKPEVFTVEELRRLREFYQPLGKDDPVRYVPCPICGQLMNRKNWGGHSGVVIDKCRNHGTWYDEGEVEKIREFVALGGVEYQKLRLTEQGIADLNSKLNKEVTRLDLRIDSAYRRARLWSLLGF